MSSIIGYASVSTREQNPQAHEAELRAATRAFIDHGESSRTGSAEDLDAAWEPTG